MANGFKEAFLAERARALATVYLTRREDLPLDRQALDQIIATVDRWYDALYADLKT